MQAIERKRNRANACVWQKRFGPNNFINSPFGLARKAKGVRGGERLVDASKTSMTGSLPVWVPAPWLICTGREAHHQDNYCQKRNTPINISRWTPISP